MYPPASPLVADLPLPEGEPFRLGVLSDTHRYSRGAAVPANAVERMGRCDAYLHCGDFVDLELLRPLRERAPLYAVLGNVDPPGCGAPQAVLLRIGAWRVGATHAAGGGPAAWRRTAGAFPERLDVLCFGHSHRPVATTSEGLVLLNPGSAVDPRALPDASVAVVALGEGLRVQLLRLPAPAHGAR
jgi:putative phosphoesterase